MKMSKLPAIILALLVTTVMFGFLACGASNDGTTIPDTTPAITTQTGATTPTLSPTPTTSIPVTSPAITTSPATSQPPAITTSTEPAPATTTPSDNLDEIIAGASDFTSIKYDMITDVPGGQTITTMVWIKGEKMRMESNLEGETVVNLFNPEIGKIYTYMPQQNMAIEMGFDANEKEEDVLDEVGNVTAYNPEVLGTETVDGKVCLKVEYGDQGTTVTMWIWKERGLPVKIVVVSNEGSTTTQYKNYSFEPIEDSVFELPQGVNIMNFPSY